jgi:hypothetical protein
MNTVESRCYPDPVAVGDLFGSRAFKPFFMRSKTRQVLRVL